MFFPMLMILSGCDSNKTNFTNEVAYHIPREIAMLSKDITTNSNKIIDKRTDFLEQKTSNLTELTNKATEKINSVEQKLKQTEQTLKQEEKQTLANEQKYKNDVHNIIAQSSQNISKNVAEQLADMPERRDPLLQILNQTINQMLTQFDAREEIRHQEQLAQWFRTREAFTNISEEFREIRDIFKQIYTAFTKTTNEIKALRADIQQQQDKQCQLIDNLAASTQELSKNNKELQQRTQQQQNTIDKMINAQENNNLLVRYLVMAIFVLLVPTGVSIFKFFKH